MNEALAGVIGMAIVAVVILLLVTLRPEPTSDFIRGITKFKWGLGGIEVERDLKAVAQKQGSAEPVRRALRDVPTVGRLLWVDDHPEHNVAEMDLLRRRGLSVDVASSNQGGVELARWRDYDLVVSDIGRDNDDDPTAGLKLPEALDDALGNKRPNVIFYTSSRRDTGIPGTVSTATPAELFQALRRHLPATES
jgi:CheY-like chemotaxis protein